MAKGKSQTKGIALKQVEYDEIKHCNEVRESVAKDGSIFGFCSKASISDTTFYRWCAIHPLFNDYYRQGLAKSRYEWEVEGELGKDDDSFNMIYWEMVGKIKYEVGKQGKIRLDMNPEVSPHEQYKELIIQASRGDFTSAEFKQIMEAISIGVRAYEVFKQQEEIDKLREDFKKMSIHNGEFNSTTT